MLIKVCTGITLVPFVAAPVIPGRTVQVQEIFAATVVVERFTAVVAAPEQMV